MMIVNFATDGFKRGQARLMKSIDGKCRGVFYDSYTHIKSPSHQKSPYEFKVHALKRAMKDHPNETIFLWCDASLFRVGDLSKIETIIERDGYFMEEAGHYVKDWCNAHARKYFNFTDAENHFTMFSAGLLGLHRNSPLSMDFFHQWAASAAAGCFIGSWKDHRHDMTCASIIAQRLNMTYQRGGSHMAYLGPGFQEPAPGVVFHLQGIF